MRSLFKILLFSLLAAQLAGCSQIGSVNGVSVGPNRVAGDNPSASYCETNPMTCILGGAAIVGATAAVVHHASRSRATGDDGQ